MAIRYSHLPRLLNVFAATMLSRVSLLLQESSLRSRLIGSSIGSLALKLSQTLLTLLLAILLARTLGPESYGVYVYAFALVSVVAIPAQLGLPALVVRETAKAQAQDRWGVVRGLWNWATITAVGTSVLLILVVSVTALSLSHYFSDSQLAAVLWGLGAIPFIALGNIRGAALCGLGRVLQGQFPEFVVRPGILAVMVLVVSLGAQPPSAQGVMALHLAASAMAFALAAWLLRRTRPDYVSDDLKPVYEPRQWFASALPLALVAGMQVINNHVDVLILEMFAPTEDLGVYRVAAQGASVVGFALAALNMTLAPRFANLYAQGDMYSLQRVVRFGSRAALVWACPIVAALWLFGAEILGFVFGTAYRSGSTALAILVAGQLANAYFGPVAFLLNMTGHERDTAWGVGAAAVTNVTLNLLLIPLLGMIGAALASAATLLLWNILLWVSARRRLGINTAAVF